MVLTTHHYCLELTTLFLDQELLQKTQARQRKAAQKLAAQPQTHSSVPIPAVATSVHAPAQQGNPPPTSKYEPVSGSA
jgi:hypothetical protein